MTGMISRLLLDRQVGVGQRLRLDALRRVDQQQRAFAGGERPRDLVREVDVPGRVDQVEHVLLAVVARVVQPDRMRLDGDAALALEVHRVEHLRLHLARLQRAGDLEKAVGQRRLAVIDVGDDREVADVAEGPCVDWGADPLYRSLRSPLGLRCSRRRAPRVEHYRSRRAARIAAGTAGPM